MQRGHVSFLKPYTAQLLSLLRVMSGLLILEHGTAKYLNLPVGQMNNASPVTMGGAAGILELVGGALLVLGILHAAGCLHSVGHDGGRLFLGARTARLLPDPE
jgi:uncharacterized membrane protein YphA (DoxX/SURF4 family)